ncbi:flagellar basal body P-ring formation chaperone FlgA [Anaeroselena agilis]|uniref:Flagellar basal body P-ring formation chaperone FlgA n=1 Tax=Anaeroselena agilis TaxID=3063788 RepID=A0ABU3P402_9FIRM|nr:flagellar basal body P-ring formation chaperone FlgA [Selenomonadales bacterium 4137-cl]
MGRILVMLAILCFYAAPAWAAPVTVAVNAEATVAGPLMTLGDLATITGDDKERVKALAAIKLGDAPSPGHRLALTSDALGARLAGSGADLSEINWLVPPTIVVTTAAQTVGGDRLLAVATEALRAQLATADGDIELAIAPVGATSDVMAPLGSVDIKAEFPAGIRFNAPTTAVTAISVDGRTFTTVSLRFNVKAFQQVVVAARNIAAREEITPDCVRTERREIGRMAGYITDIGKVVGLAARRPITAGTPLTEAAVDKPVMVRRGAAVIIVAKAGGMIITAGGRAMQDGREGEAIRVQNVTSKRILSARVVDPNTVQVIIYGGR